MRNGHDTTAADVGGTYPAAAGWKEPTTSREVIHARILTLLELIPSGLSAHEIAGRLALPRSTVSPRMSELRRQGKIRPSGKRTKNDSGCTAHVWVLWSQGVPDVDAASLIAEEINRVTVCGYAAINRGAL